MTTPQAKRRRRQAYRKKHGRPGGPRLKQLRAQVRKRDGDLCWLCGERINFDCRHEENRQNPDGATLEHIVEAKDGGKYKLDNLKLSHARCNWARSNRKKGQLQ